MSARKQFRHRVNATGISISHPDTESYFDSSYIEENTYSPIDKFILNSNKLNLLYSKVIDTSGDLLSPDLVRTQYNLILLGYISAVESYLREIIRKLIVIDSCCRTASENRLLSFGAAVYYEKELLPEALLENCSFASKKNIIDSFKNFLGIKGHCPQEVDSILSNFEKICHLRHCIIHRFGKLGSNNAIKFGLDSHSKCLEKPISLNEDKLYEIYLICENTVLVLNHYLYEKILFRTIEPEHSEWTWDLRKDKEKFQKYYYLFASSKKPPEPTSNLQDAYTALRNYKLL